MLRKLFILLVLSLSAACSSGGGKSDSPTKDVNAVSYYGYSIEGETSTDGTISEGVDRIKLKAMIFTECYDQLIGSNVEVCRGIDVYALNTPYPEISVCKNVLLNCMGYKYKEIADTTKVWTLYKALWIRWESVDPQFEENGITKYTALFNGGPMETSPNYEDGYLNTTIKIPPLNAESRTLALIDAYGCFRDAAIAGAMIIEDATSMANLVSSFGSDASPNMVDYLTTGTLEATTQLKSVGEELAKNQVSVANAIPAKGLDYEEAQKLKWEGKVNSVNGALHFIVGKPYRGLYADYNDNANIGTIGAKLRISTDAEKKALKYLRYLGTGDVLRYQDNQQNPIVISTLIEDIISKLSTEEQIIFADVQEFFTKTGTTIADFLKAREYLINEADVFNKQVNYSGTTTATLSPTGIEPHETVALITSNPELSVDGTPTDLVKINREKSLIHTMDYVRTSLNKFITTNQVSNPLSDSHQKQLSLATGVAASTAGTKFQRSQVTRSGDSLTYSFVAEGLKPGENLLVLNGREGYECAKTGKVNGETCDIATYTLSSSAPETTDCETRNCVKVVSTQQTSGTSSSGLYTAIGAPGKWKLSGVFAGPKNPLAEGHYYLRAPFAEKTVPAFVNPLIQRPVDDAGESENVCGENDLLRGVVPPMENELTSDSDNYESSWKHYLTVAMQAAQQTDELAERMVQNGLQMDHSSEAARQKLEEICGGTINSFDETSACTIGDTFTVMGSDQSYTCTPENQFLPKDGSLSNCMPNLYGDDDRVEYTTLGNQNLCIYVNPTNGGICDCIEGEDCPACPVTPTEDGTCTGQFVGTGYFNESSNLKLIDNKLGLFEYSNIDMEAICNDIDDIIDGQGTVAEKKETIKNLYPIIFSRDNFKRYGSQLYIKESPWLEIGIWYKGQWLYDSFYKCQKSPWRDDSPTLNCGTKLKYEPSLEELQTWLSNEYSWSTRLNRAIVMSNWKGITENLCLGQCAGEFLSESPLYSVQLSNFNPEFIYPNTTSIKSPSFCLIDGPDNIHNYDTSFYDPAGFASYPYCNIRNEVDGYGYFTVLQRMPKSRSNKSKFNKDNFYNNSHLDAISMVCKLMKIEIDQIQGYESLPDINSRQDIYNNYKIIDDFARRIESVASQIIIPRLPKKLIDGLQRFGFESHYPSVGGAYLDTFLQIERDLQSFAYGILSLKTNMQILSSNIEKFYLELDDTDLKKKLIRLREKKKQWGRAFSFVSNVVQLYNNPNPGSVYQSLASLGMEIGLDAAYGTEEEIEEKLLNNAKEKIYQDTMITINKALLDLNTAYTDILTNYQSIQKNISHLDTLEKQAYEAWADMNFLDNDISGHVLNANTSTRRVQNTLVKRYQDSLKRARKLAYIARRAIEFRLGEDMSTMNESMTLVDAPSTWADRVCEFEGVDYTRIRSTAATEDATLLANDNYAHQYIGDYVRMLNDFVESYSIDRPFTNSDDLAVLSVKNDLMSAWNICPAKGNNELYYSSHMNQNSELEDGEIVGWFTAGCGENEICISAYSMDATEMVEETIGDATQLVEVAYNYSVIKDIPIDGKVNAGYITQTITADGTGCYILSYKDKYGAVNLPYRIEIIGTESNDSTNILLTSTIPSMNSEWTERVFNFNSTSETIRLEVRIYPSDLDNSYDAGDIYLRNFQLEKRRLGDDEVCGTQMPDMYDETADSLIVKQGSCKNDNASAFRANFVRKCICDSNGNYCEDYSGTSSQCFREYAFNLDLNAVENGDLIQSHAIAVNNFNYRHNSIALNIVGTNVISCDSSTSSNCYTNAYIPYTLVHDGKVSVRNYDGQKKEFKMPTAYIEHGKALTGEFVITNPMTGTHSSMLAPYQKQNFRGRPLQGSYFLRIWETENLDWDKIEDIQLIWNYRYWTRSSISN